MSGAPEGPTRRAFLERLGLLGGVGATYLGMQALGLMNTPPAAAEMFRLPAGSGRGKSVVILGAGIAGLVSAYEMKRAGWNVTVLEARGRPGGRSWTVRGGDRIEQTGRPDQVCTFEQGLYMNAGPARIPAAHHVILGYAKALGVQMEVMVNANRASRIDMGGRVIESRQLINDVRGGVSEMLAKAIDGGALNARMSEAERTHIREFLGFYGELAESGDYRPQGRSGYTDLPGAYNHPGHTRDPLSLRDMMNAPGLGLPLLFEEIFDQQSPMFQPVGGMDRIALALYRDVQRDVRLNWPIGAIRRIGERVRIEYGGSQDRTVPPVEADYCICTLPLTTLQRVQTDFTPAKRAAIADVPYVVATKVGFETPRFWEDEGIYGGLGWTDGINENLLYPSGGWNSAKGILVAAYCLGWTSPDHPQRFAAMSHEERFAACRASVDRLHPGQAARLAKPLTVAWSLTPWSEGVGPASPDWASDGRPGRYQELMRPEGPIYFAGEHLSYITFWQEGAATSAHEAMRALQARVAA